MKFHKNSLKLAGLYLAVMMAISLFFSASLYQLSVQEFDRGLRRPGPGSAINRLPEDGPDRIRGELLQEREDQYQAAKERILQRLVLVNILIVISGGALSYYLALRTLRPIEEAHDAQSRFTADASHELRTPIAAMQTETEVALMDPKLTLAKAKQILKSNLEELNKLTELSEGLLTLAQAENIELQASELPLTAVIQKAVNRVTPLAEQKDILISLTVPAEIKILADENSLTEAFVVLLDNAVKYSPAETAIRVTAAAESKNTVIKIADQGMGIKATELPHIFDRFYRADSARSKQQATGYGLGLAIAKNIIEMHQGKIDVSSKPSVGSTFEVRLPKTKNGYN